MMPTQMIELKSSPSALPRRTLRVCHSQCCQLPAALPVADLSRLHGSLPAHTAGLLTLALFLSDSLTIISEKPVG